MTDETIPRDPHSIVENTQLTTEYTTHVPDAAETAVSKTSDTDDLRTEIIFRQLHSRANLPDNEVGEATQSFLRQLEIDGRPEDRNTAELLNSLPVTTGVMIGKQGFYLSEVVNAGPRDYCIGYVKLGDHIAPRLFYKSRSQGEWRSCPNTVQYEENGRTKRNLSKGETMDYGYARETQINDNLALALETKAQKRTHRWEPKHALWIMDHFTDEKLGANNTYKEEAFEVRMAHSNKEALYAFQPGRGFETVDGGKTAREIFMQAIIEPERLPDFAEPISSITTEHPILGSVTTEKYVARDSYLVWSMSYDSKGRVWVAGAGGAFEDTPNTYGTSEEVLSLGILDNKPLEYREQVQGLEPGVDFHEVNQTYVDITPLLDNLQIVRQFRAARHIERATA